MKSFFKTKLCFFLLGAVIFSSITAGAASLIYSKDITYDNTSSGLKSTTVQGALDELYESAKNAPNCNSNGECTTNCSKVISNETKYVCLDETNIYTKANLGDYIYMTPSSSSYSTNTAYTGCTNSSYCGGNTTQTINPKELNLWRILNKYDDGTVDLISAYVSSINIYFYGNTGYKNLVGQLNLLAKAYENSKYTKSSRYLGYNGQTEFCTNYYDSNCQEVIGNTESENKAAFHKDVDQVKNIISLQAYKANSTTMSNYWIASRKFHSESQHGACLVGHSSDTKSWYIGCDQTAFYDSTNRYYEKSSSYALRPIVTLKSTVKIESGNGTENSPYVLSVQ